jgi:hypothetical protein
VTEKPDTNELRNLDAKKGDSYRVLLMSDLFGSRGVDYRAPKNGICQIIGSSFSGIRKKYQTYKRVGRFGDDCHRIRDTSVTEID